MNRLTPNLILYIFLTLMLFWSGCKDDSLGVNVNSESTLRIVGGGHSLEWGFSYFTPSVLTPETTGDVILEVYLNDLPASPVLQTSWNQSIRLFDNGKDEDKIASDHVYTAKISSSDILAANTPDQLNRPFIGFIDLNDGFFSVFAEVWSNSIQMVDIVPIDSTIQRTSRIVNIATPAISLSDREEYVRHFYSYFEDEYDFINIIYPGFAVNRHHVDVKLDVQGIGKTQIDRTSSYGSDGRLIGVNVFPNTGFYDGANNGYQHELGHQWVNFLSGTPFETSIPHWPLSDLANSIMGYSQRGAQGGEFPYDLIKQENNSWLLQSKTTPYIFNDLELYLMGLVPSSEVTSHFVFNDQDQAAQPGASLNGPITTITIEEIIATLGPRIPDVQSSPKEFKIATIIISSSLLSAEEMSFYDFYTERAELTTTVSVKEGHSVYTSNPFYLSTGERAKLITTL